ncbi:MAG: hypothetical protein CME69_09990 [Halobacteriovorax sp.]|nr:hypothetical protein [Halobacteriovorax sp.]
MLNIAYIMGFIGVAVGIMIGVFIFTEVENSVDCPDININPDGNAGCQKAKSLSWAVVGILPIAMFFGLFTLFGGFNQY